MLISVVDLKCWVSLRLYFDFRLTYVGCGLICPHIVNCSVLLGAIISWGFLWPFISTKAGDWYPEGLGSNDFKGLYGYKVLEFGDKFDQMAYSSFPAGYTIKYQSISSMRCGHDQIFGLSC